MIIRKAEIKDIDRLVDLGRKFFSESHLFGRLNHSEENTKATLSWMIVHDGCVVLIAEDGDNVAGGCIWVLDKMWTKEPIAFESIFYINPEYRRGGVAKTLLQESIRMCENAGASFMYSTSTAGFSDGGVNARAYKMLFKSCGFDAMHDSAVLVRGIKGDN